MGIQQGRLWAVRNSSVSPIFHVVGTGLPTLFKTRKDAEKFKQRIKKEFDCNSEVVEIEVVAK